MFDTRHAPNDIAVDWLAVADQLFPPEVLQSASVVEPLADFLIASRGQRL